MIESHESFLLKQYLDDLGLSCTDDQREALLEHLDLVLEKNKVLNLTRIVKSPDTLILHICDSLLFNHPSIDAGFKSNSNILDIGTGAGFPGIPLSITTDSSFCLIDSVGKKVSAVNEFIAQLSLSDRLTAKQTRAEELALSSSASFTHVVARAVAELRVLIEYAAPLLQKGGSLIVSKSHVSDLEAKDAQRASNICGLTLVDECSFELPDSMGSRVLYKYMKTSQPKIHLPRQVGFAKHRPL